MNMFSIHHTLALAATLCVHSIASAACADFREDVPVLNVSTTRLASALDPVIACAMIDPMHFIDDSAAFLTEADVGDAVMEIRYVSGGFPQRTADDWGSDLSADEKTLLLGRLRAPERNTDAALLLKSDPAQAGQELYGVCVYGYPKTGEARTSVSITTLRMPAASDCQTNTTVYFEH